MIKKAVPISILLSACGVQAQNYLTGTWVPSTTQSTTNCCYFSGNMVVGAGTTASSANGATVTGNADITNPVASTSSAGPCQFYVAGTTTPKLVSGAWTSLTIANQAGNALSADDGAAPTAVSGGAAGASFTVDATGVTLTFVPSSITTTACTGQTFSRSTTAVSGADGTYTASTGVAGSATTSAACCFLDTATNVVVATANSRTTVTGKTGTCTNGGSAAVTKILKASGTTGTYNDLSGVNSFIVNSDGTITYSPTGVTTGTSACTQTLTKNSSGASRLMTPVVVGAAAALGLVVV